MPAEFRITYLTKLFKGRGSPNELGNNRFIHGKSFIPKIFEKCVVKMIDTELRNATPEFQIGGQFARSTRDHLLQLFILASEQQRKGKPVIFTLVDIRKCFDKVSLQDCIYESLKAGCDPKATNVIKKFSEVTDIKLRGDPTGKMATVRDVTGQGSGYAPLACALLIGKRVEEELIVKDIETMIVFGVPVDPSLFIDDINDTSDSPDMARARGIAIGHAIDRAALKINETKTVVLVMGNNAVKDAWCQQLEARPVMMQDKRINLTDNEKYLGFQLSSKGMKDSIKMTMNDRINKTRSKIKDIKNIISNDLVQMHGWLKAGLTLFQAYVPATMLYSAEMWFLMDKGMVEQLEKAYKHVLYSVLEIPRNTKKSAVFHELGLMDVMYIVHQRQITYVNYVRWEMSESKVHRFMMEEWIARGDDSVLGKVTMLCRNYGLPDVAIEPVDPDLIRDTIKQMCKVDMWGDAMLSRIVNSSPDIENITRLHWEMPRSHARALLFFKTGALKVKETWRQYNSTKYGNVKCPVPKCDNDDTALHLLQCGGYDANRDARHPVDIESDLDVTDRLVKLNAERVSKYRMSVL